MLSSFEYRKQKNIEVRQLLEYLKNIQVSVEKLLWHPEVCSCMESKIHYDIAKYDINQYGLCKNLFLRNKRGNSFWLVIIDFLKEVDLEILRQLLNTSKLMLAQNNNLREILKVESGSVSIFNIVNDVGKIVNVIIDEELLLKKLLVFHPNYNGASIFIKPNEVTKFLERLNCNYSVMNIPKKEEITKELIYGN